MLIPFEGDINTGDPQGLKIYLQATNKIEKEDYKINTSLSNDKAIIYHFLSISNKYGLLCLVLMLWTGASAKNFFRRVEKTQMSDMNHQGHWYFGLIVIGNVENNIIPNLLVLSALHILSGSTEEVQISMIGCAKKIISKETEGSNTNISIRKLRLHRGRYEWADAGGIIKKYKTNMITL